MDTIDKPVPVKWNIIRVSGILLILLSLYSLWIAYDQVQVKTAIDYFREVSCDDFPPDIQRDTRIAYCISFKLIKNDMALFIPGSTNLDEVTNYGLNIKRQGQTIFVNNQPLQAGERYNVVHRNFANPWLIIMTHIDIYQYVLAEPSAPDNALYVTGTVLEDWQVSPLGAIILVSGIGLVILGDWGEKRKKIAREQYVMEPSVPRNIKARDIAVGFFGWIIFSTLSFPLLYLLYRFFALTIFGHFNEYDNLFLIWLPAIITILVLYRKKRFLICTGVVLAIAVNSAIWLSILRADNFFFDALLLSGIPVPLILLALLVITLL